MRYEVQHETRGRFYSYSVRCYKVVDTEAHPNCQILARRLAYNDAKRVADALNYDWIMDS